MTVLIMYPKIRYLCNQQRRIKCYNVVVTSASHQREAVHPKRQPLRSLSAGQSPRGRTTLLCRVGRDLQVRRHREDPAPGPYWGDSGLQVPIGVLAHIPEDPSTRSHQGEGRFTHLVVFVSFVVCRVARYRLPGTWS